MAEEHVVHPAERLRQRLLSARGRFWIVIGVLVLWLMDTLVSHRLVDAGAVADAQESLVLGFETLSTYIFVVTSALLLVAILRPYPSLILKFSAIYLTFAVIQVIANVFAMLATAGMHSGGGLGGLWDVGAVYAMCVLVFTYVYILFDITTPGGAFVWPARDGEEPPVPNLLDYLFISLNVNSTYGPTSEAVMARPVKLVMAGQVLLAILMLTVLISRAVSATSG